MQTFKITNNKSTHLYKGPSQIVSVQQYAQKVFQSGQSVIHFFYIDEDGDKITVSCDQDLEVISEMQIKPKINIEIEQIPVQNEEKTIINSIKLTPAKKIVQELKNEEELKEDIQIQKTENDINQKLQQSKAIHQNIICDGCKAYPVIGNRYKCAQCCNFDFCEKCFENNIKSNLHDHKFTKYDKPVKRTVTHVFTKNLNNATNLKMEIQQQNAKSSVQNQVNSQYNQACYQKAKFIAEVLGGNPIEYYGVCKYYENDELDYIIEQIMITPEHTAIIPTEF